MPLPASVTANVQTGRVSGYPACSAEGCVRRPYRRDLCTDHYRSARAAEPTPPLVPASTCWRVVTAGGKVVAQYRTEGEAWGDARRRDALSKRSHHRVLSPDD
jgi:hypothetical protein